MNKPFPALCNTCKHSTPEVNFEWNNRCHHPLVIAKDSWALASNEVGGKNGRGVNCREERERVWFAPCGQKGKLWEERIKLPAAGTPGSES